MDDDGDLGWWVLPGRVLLEMLHRTANGEDPDLVFAEAYANSCHEKH